MTDSLTEQDYRDVDANVDPSALTQDDIEESIPDDFPDKAKQAIAAEVSQRRDAVVESVSLDDRTGRNPLTDQPMIKNEQGQFAAAADRVERTYVDESDAGFKAELDDGSTVRMDSVDLQAGAPGGAQRADRGSSGWETQV